MSDNVSDSIRIRGCYPIRIRSVSHGHSSRLTGKRCTASIGSDAIASHELPLPEGKQRAIDGEINHGRDEEATATQNTKNLLSTSS